MTHSRSFKALLGWHFLWFFWINDMQIQSFLSSVQSLSRVWLFVTPRTAACQASLSITNSWSLPKHMPIESVIPSNHLILCCPLLLLPSIFPSIRVFSNESVLSEVGHYNNSHHTIKSVSKTEAWFSWVSMTMWWSYHWSSKTRVLRYWNTKPRSIPRMWTQKKS